LSRGSPLQLPAKPPRPLMREDLLNFQAQLNTELKRCNNLNEQRLSDVLRATEAVLHCCERHERRVVSLESSSRQQQQRQRQQQSPQRRSRSLQIERKSQVNGAEIARALATRTESCTKLLEPGLAMMLLPPPAAVDSSEDDNASGSKMFEGRAMQVSTADGGMGADSHTADVVASAVTLPRMHPPPPLPLEPVSERQLTPNNAGRFPSFEDGTHFSSSTLPRPTATKFWTPDAGTAVDCIGVGPPAASCASSSSSLPPAPRALGAGNALSRSSCMGAEGVDGAIPAMHHTSGERRSSRRSVAGDQNGPRSRDSVAF